MYFFQVSMLYFLLAYNCPGEICNFQSKKLHSFTQHLQSIRTCCKCEKEFHGRHTKRAYENHLKKHVVKPKLNCDPCGKSFDYKSQIKQHLISGKCGRTDFGANFMGW